MIIYNYTDLDIIPLINYIPQIQSIYIFNHDHYRLNNENYVIGRSNKKVKGVYSHIEQMCYILRQDLYRLSNYSSVSVLSSSSNLSFAELDPSFMYTQLIQGVSHGNQI